MHDECTIIKLLLLIKEVAGYYYESQTKFYKEK